MASRQDIDEFAASTDAATRARLDTVVQVLAFAERRLELPANGSYRRITVLDREHVNWILVATPEFSLAPKTWCFLVVGCVPYKAYFDHDAARRAERKLARRGLDTRLAGAAAYSTLGWFDDPLLDTMLERPDPDLAGLLFHELAHQKLYLKGDTRFSESYASFIERQGVRDWLGEQGRHAELAQWEDRREAAGRRARRVADLRARLAAIYTSRRDEAGMRASKQAEFAAFAAEDHGSGASRGPAAVYNNADLVLLDSYQGGVCAFRRLFQQAGNDIQQFHRLAREHAALPAAQRGDWLEQPC